MNAIRREIDGIKDCALSLVAVGFVVAPFFLAIAAVLTIIV